MRFTTSLLTLVFSITFAMVGPVSSAEAQLFFDDFEDRTQDQALIGNNWLAFDQSFSTDTCTGTPIGAFGPIPAENRNYFTASADVGQGDSYFRAGLEVPAWDGATSNMMRVYGNQYNANPDCQRVLVFQDIPNIAAGDYTFSFDVAKDRYGAPANGEIIGAFVKVLKSSDNSYGELIFTTIASASPADATTAAQSIDFTIPAEMAGELLQIGFYNDLSPNLGQSWQTSGAYYDNVRLVEFIVPPPPYEGNTQGVPVPFWAYMSMIVLLLFMGGSVLRSRRNNT